MHEHTQWHMIIIIKWITKYKYYRMQSAKNQNVKFYVHVILFIIYYFMFLFSFQILTTTYIRCLCANISILIELWESKWLFLCSYAAKENSLRSWVELLQFYTGA